jgi:hypothetical protein
LNHPVLDTSAVEKREIYDTSAVEKREIYEQSKKISDAAEWKIYSVQEWRINVRP